MEAKVNYSIPKYQMASIYKGLRRLSRKIRKLYFYMTQTDRIVYYDDAKRQANECLKDFCIAFDFQDERPHWYMKLVGDLHTLTALIDEIRDERVLRNPPKKIKDENTGTLTTVPGTTEKILIQIYEEIGRIDEDISKWRSVALSSKNASTQNPL